MLSIKKQYYFCQLNTALHFFGGEGSFLATLSGTGSVWIQSMPFSRLAERVLAHSVGNTQGEG